MHRAAKDSDYTQGYTLIEIVLVLALAGLIMVMVFLTVSQAQKTRRDFQRKRDLSAFVAGVAKFSTNNSGKIPSNQAELNIVEQDYASNAKDPSSGQNYNDVFRSISVNHDTPDVGRGPGVPAVGSIYFQSGHRCADPSVTSDPIEGNDLSTEKFVAWIGMEQGGFLCEDNN